MARTFATGTLSQGESEDLTMKVKKSATAGASKTIQLAGGSDADVGATDTVGARIKVR